MAGLTTSYYTLNGEILGESTGGVRLDYLTDALGSVTATLDQATAATHRLRYKPSGANLLGPVLKIGWCGTHGYIGTGRRTVNDFYVTARHYATKMGQWTTRDPLWPRERAYGYVNGHTTIRTDPSGLCFQRCITGPCPPPVLCGQVTFDPIIYGETGCDPKSGNMWSTSCDCTVTGPCTDAHEWSHRIFGQGCCQAYAKCLKSTVPSYICDDLYDEWFDSNYNFSECMAYTISSSCLYKLWYAQGCDGQGNHLSAACKFILDNIHNDTKQRDKYCAFPKGTDCHFPSSFVDVGVY